MRRNPATPAIWLVVVVAVGLTVAGCSSTGGSADSSVAHAPQSVQAGGPTGTDGSSGSGGTAVGVAGGKDSTGGTGTVVDGTTRRQVITTGSAEIVTRHPVSAGDSAAHIAESAGGRVDDRSQTSPTRHQPGTATLTLRIPSTGLTDAIDQLKKLGSVRSSKLATQDVTTTIQDLGARITALKTTVARLLALEAKARTTADLLAIENDISERQADLDSLTTQQKYLGDQVEMSTLTVTFVSPTVAVKTPPPSPADAFTAGLAGFGSFFTWVFLVLTYLVPWLGLAAVMAAGAVIVVRRRRRRHTSAA